MPAYNQPNCHVSFHLHWKWFDWYGNLWIITSPPHSYGCSFKANIPLNQNRTKKRVNQMQNKIKGKTKSWNLWTYSYLIQNQSYMSDGKSYLVFLLSFINFQATLFLLCCYSKTLSLPESISTLWENYHRSFVISSFMTEVPIIQKPVPTGLYTIRTSVMKDPFRVNVPILMFSF